MISKEIFIEICEKYGLNANKIIKKNNKVLKNGKYEEITEILDYLINELKIDLKNIEKCPSIFYGKKETMENNVEFIKKSKINFTNIESCLHVLNTETDQLIETYNYVSENYNMEDINNNTTILSCNKDIIKDVENLELPFKNKKDNLQVAVGIKFKYTTIEKIKKVINSKEYKEQPEFFTGYVLSCANFNKIQEILQSKECKEHPELFMAITLRRGKIDNIKRLINSEEYKNHPEFFTKRTLSFAKIEEIQKMLQSPEYKEHSELFTAETLAHAKIESIQEMLQSPEYKEHPELFTAQTLVRSKIKEIQRMLQSPEYEEHPELFTKTTLARTNIDIIRKVLHSKEYKEYPELFTSQTLSYVKIEDIQKILHLSCPQPIYRWFKGSILPSVDHLYVMSRLLKVHMEDLLVPECEYSIVTEKYVEKSLGEKILYEYWKRLCIKKCA